MHAIKEQTRIDTTCRREFAWFLRSSLLLLICSAGAFSQTYAGPVQASSSLSLDSVSVYSSYMRDIEVPGIGAVGSEFGEGAAATLRWARIGQKSDFSLSYTAAYDGRLGYSNALSHMLSLNSGHRLGSRWHLRYSLGANVLDTEQLLFMPNFLTQVAEVPTTFDDLTNALLHGTFNNSQLLPLYTGVQAVKSPTLLLYGTRILSASGQVSLAYDFSRRTSIEAWVSGARVQALSNGGEEQLAGGLLPVQSTTDNVSIGVSHSVDPRTQLNVQVTSTEVVSAYEDALYSQASVSATRTLNRRWFATAQGGGGASKSLRQVTYLPGGLQPTYGGTIGFKTFSHTFLATVQRSFVDSYGLGATSAITASGAWNWARPDRPWKIGASFSQSRMEGGLLSQIDSWQVGATFTRTLGLGTTAFAAYSYARYTGGASASSPLVLTPNTARVGLTWNPMFGSRH